MARKLRIGFDQGPYELVAQTGKYGILHPRATFSASSAPTTLRRYAAGHYIAWPTPLGASGIPNGGTVAGTYPNATVTGGGPSNAGPAVRSSTNGQTGNLVTAGFVIRHNWSEINPTGSTYSYTRCDQQLAQARALGMPVVFMIVVRTFDGTTAPGGTNPATNPLPADLQAPFTGAPYGYAESFSTGASGSTRYGFQVWRWSPTIRSRYFTLCQKLGARYNGDIYFGGIATRETASGTNPTGGSATVYTVNGYTGQDIYTAQGFLDGLNDENDSISTQCPNARGFPYQNFMASPFPSGQNAQSMILQYGTHVQPNGSWFGCPDLVTGTSGNSNIVNNVYPNLQKFHLGDIALFLIPGPTFAAVQNGEWNGTGVGDTPPNIANLFNYATSSFSCKPADGYTGALDWTTGSPLKCDAIMWDYEIGVGTPNFTTNLVPIMKAFPTFGTYVPAGSSGAFDYYISPTGSNSNDGLTTSTPWAITAINTKRATYAGKTVGLMDGTYDVLTAVGGTYTAAFNQNILEIASGDSTHQTIIQSINPRAAILDFRFPTFGNYAGCGGLGATTGTGYVTCKDIKLINAGYRGMNFSNTDGTTVYHGIIIDGIWVYNQQFNPVTINPGANSCGIGFYYLIDGAIVRNCRVEASGAPRDGDRWAAMIHFNATNCIFQNNTFIRSVFAGNASDQVIHIKNNLNVNNIIRYNYCVGIILVEPNGCNELHHNVILSDLGIDTNGYVVNWPMYNNTIVSRTGGWLNGTGSGAIRTYSNGSGGVMGFYNNILSRTTYSPSSYDVNYPSSALARGTIDYNAIADNSPTPAYNIGAGATTYTGRSAWNAATGNDAHSLELASAGFTSTGTEAARYKLAVGSSCINAGKSDGTTGGTTCDMGAWGNNPPVTIGCDF